MLLMLELNIEDLLRIGTVLVSLCVVSAPILYPRYSLFVRRALLGIQKLQTTREQDENVRIGYIEQGEEGFEELVSAANVVFSLSEEIERICLAAGNPPDLGEYTGFGMQFGIGDNGVLFGEAISGEKILLRWDSANPSSTLNLEKLRAGVVLKAQDRSHTVTMALAVLWATLSVIVVF